MILLNFDKRGAEWSVIAYLTGDSNMIAAVNSGKSPHVVTGHLMSCVSEELIKKEAKLLGEMSDPNLLYEARRDKLPELLTAYFLPRNMTIRQCGKKANFGLNYGEQFRTFALMNEIEETEAKRIINLYRHEAYPGILDWYQRIQKQLHKDRTLTNCFGRKCYFMEAWGEDLFRQGYAFLPQSTVGDMVNEGIIKTINDPTLGHVQLLSQVHDSGVFQAPMQTSWRAFARDCIKIGLDYLSPECEYTAKFTIPTDLKIGKNWGSTNMVEVHLTRDEGKLADDLAAAWEQCNTRKEAA